MNKVKLPRKRKKAYLKTLTRGEYLADQIVGEMLGDARFPKRYKHRMTSRVRVVSWW